jgi:hypothetical protein
MSLSFPVPLKDPLGLRPADHYFASDAPCRFKLRVQPCIGALLDCSAGGGGTADIVCRMRGDTAPRVKTSAAGQTFRSSVRSAEFVAVESKGSGW